jgi:hypothetical protein
MIKLSDDAHFVVEKALQLLLQSGLIELDEAHYHRYSGCYVVTIIEVRVVDVRKKAIEAVAISNRLKVHRLVLDASETIWKDRD